MIRFLRDIEISKLLGIKDLDEKKRNKYLADKLKLVLQNAIKSALEESDLPEEKLDYILKLLEKNESTEKIQIEALKLMPQLLKLIEEEIYTLKKSIVLEQVEEVEQTLNDEVPNEKFFLVTIADLKNKLSQENDMEFEDIWNLFSEKRDEFLVRI